MFSFHLSAGCGDETPQADACPYSRAGAPMNLEQLLTKNRSYRRFHEECPVDRQTLLDLVALTRWCPSGANRQPLKYYLACSPEQNAEVFGRLGWAKWLPDWPGPEPGERPAGYIVILGDTQIADRFDQDCAIAAYTILLGATARGLGGCMIGWIDRERLAETLNLPERYRILMVVALGVPKETVVIEDRTGSDDITYWRDKAGVHHVPKRTLEELVVQGETPVACASAVECLDQHAGDQLPPGSLAGHYPG
jgi:nitroreductase